MANASIYHDKRKQVKKDGTYPVKVQISYERKQRFYSTGVSCTPDGFEYSYNNVKAKGEHKQVRDKIVEAEKYANEIIEKLEKFSFDALRFGSYVNLRTV